MLPRVPRADRPGDPFRRGSVELAWHYDHRRTAFGRWSKRSMVQISECRQAFSVETGSGKPARPFRCKAAPCPGGGFGAGSGEPPCGRETPIDLLDNGGHFNGLTKD